MQIINVSKLNGKLAGFRAIGTNTKSNKFCEKMYNSKGDIICKFCYSHKALEIAYNKNLEPYLQHNTEVLENNIITEFVYRQGGNVTTKLNDAYFRFSQHGELDTINHLINFMNIAKDNPKTTFGFWTKRKDLIKEYVKENDIPENVIMVYSNPKINNVMYEPPKNFDKVFNNVWPEFEPDKQNCTGQRCIDCLRCYDKDRDNVIIEAVK